MKPGTNPPSPILKPPKMRACTSFVKSFGGSTIILFVKKEKIIIDKDIIEQTIKGFETKINAGDPIGKKIIL